MKIYLGTAQFDLNYGITNSNGKMPIQDIHKILQRSNKDGIIGIDTAKDYGETEKILGNFNINDFEISTKLPFINMENNKIENTIFNLVNNSLKKMKIKMINNLFLHYPNQLLEPKGAEIYKSLLKLKDNGIIKNIGYSIYSPLEAKKLINFFHPDIIQGPYSIFDRRMEKTGLLFTLKKLNILFQARSISLQGLLYLNADKLPKKFLKWKDIWIKYEKFLLENKINSAEAIINFIFTNKNLTNVVVGFNNYDQYRSFVEIKKNLKEHINYDINFDNFDETILNPNNWESL